MPEITTGATKIADLNGLFKEVYVDKLQDITPKSLKLQVDVKFNQRDRIGTAYNQPVLLQHEHGFTYAASGAGAFALNGNISGLTQNARVQGSELVLQSALAYDAASRASSGGRRAFLAATELLVMNMWESAKKRLEIALFYGQQGIGVVDSINTTDNTIFINKLNWAPGIWGGAEGAEVQILTSDLQTERTGSPIKIASVDISARKLTYSVTGGFGDPTGVMAGDVLFWKGEIVAGVTPTHKNFVGLHKILGNAGTLFEINAASFGLWLGNTQSAGTTDLSFNTVQRAVAKAVGKGADSDMILYIPSLTWANLMSDQAALRRFTSQDGKRGAYEQGAESIRFYCQAGSIEVKPSIYVHEGFAYLVEPSCWERIGSSDITFRRPDRGDEFFRDLSANAGYELRAWSDQALFCYAPGKNCIITNVLNTD
jgi:hypothetical protein